MRITGGRMGGRKIRVPARGVRPTQDRVRESIFSMLMGAVEGARVLDAYAGSGSLGLEAWSRGAESVCWVERNRGAFKVLHENVAELGGDAEERYRCVCADAVDFVAQAESNSFDLVFADPPYDKTNELGRLNRVLIGLKASGCLAIDGLLIYEMSKDESFDLPGQWRLLRDRSWGETRVLILQRGDGG